MLIYKNLQKPQRLLSLQSYTKLSQYEKLFTLFILLNINIYPFGHKKGPIPLLTKQNRAKKTYYY